MKKFWQSTNFWTAVLLAVGALFVGFPEGAARDTVAALFALIASSGIIRNFVKEGVGFDWKQIKTANFWNYVATAITAIVPQIPAELFSRLQELATHLVGGNWQGILVSVFSIATILYHLVKNAGSGKPNVLGPLGIRRELDIDTLADGRR